METMKRIVLIDDDSTTNYLNKLIIERSELVDEVLTFDSAEEALNFFNQNNDPEDESLVLLDINMPKVTGYEVLQYFCDHPQILIPPILVLSSTTKKRDIITCYQLQASAFIPKDFNINDFQKTIFNTFSFWGQVNKSPF